MSTSVPTLVDLLEAVVPPLLAQPHQGAALDVLFSHAATQVKATPHMRVEHIKQILDLTNSPRCPRPTVSALRVCPDQCI